MILGLIVACTFSLAAHAETPGQRPYELEWAGRHEDTRKPLIDFEDLHAWTVTQQDAVAVFTPSREQQIWGDSVGKLVYRSAGSKPVITLTPPQPVPVPDSFDCVNLWAYGNNWGWAPDPSTPAVEFRILLQSAGGTTPSIGRFPSRWKEWWLMHHRLTSEQLTQLGKHPRFIGIEIRNGHNKEDRTIYFDNLAIYTEPLAALTFEPRPKRNLTLPQEQPVGNNTGPGMLPFPTREETILPDNLTDKFQVSLEQANDVYEFRYTGDDGELVFRYQPASGTLSDVTAEWVGRGDILQPLDGGEVVLSPAKPADTTALLTRELLNCQQQGDTVCATWRYTQGDQTTDVTYTLQLWQKSLVIDVQCSEAVVGEFKVGQVLGAEDPRIVTVPFLAGAEQRPGILVSGPADNPLFVSVLLDHYRTNSSSFWFSNRVTEGVAVISGGARYQPKTDGNRNRCFERLFLTVAPRFEETLPNIPNPKSPWMHVAGERVWRAHGASNRQYDFEFWKKVARYGMSKVAITDHETGWRDGGESFTMRTRAAPGKGGDEGQAEYARKIRALGFRYGIYNNYTDYAPVNEHWSEDFVTRTPENQWQTAWPRCYNPKPSRAVELEARLAPIIQDKFQLSTAYCDVHTAVRPWSYCDFDARVPGAGTFAATFYAYGEIMLHQKATWNGPVYSEGNNHWYYCGLTDGNYGQDQLGQVATSPWLVDFDLLKLHPLCCNFGMGSPGMFYGNNQRLGSTVDQREERLDRFLAATLAFGHTGFLVFDGGFENAVQSYFCLQQVHANYAQQSVTSIRYADEHGNLLDTSRAVASGAYRRSQIVTRYGNGLEVFVNGHTADSWQTPHATLPPNGWYVHNPDDNTLKALSAIVDGHRADYVDSPDYVYANGRGVLTRFPKATCDGQLIAKRQEDGTTELIPLSNCHVMGIDLDGQAATAVALDASRKPIGAAVTRHSRELVYVLPTADAVSYLLTPVPPARDSLQCQRIDVVPGDSVDIQGARPNRYRVAEDVQIGSQLWHQVDDKWIDFTVTPLVDAQLNTTDNAYQLTLIPRTQLSLDAQIQFGPHTRSAKLLPGQSVQLAYPRTAPNQETVETLQLAITAGELQYRRQWWVKSEYSQVQLAKVSEFSDAGQRRRSEVERPLDAKTGAGVYWAERACDDDYRHCLFMHPPYNGGVGYSFAQLPSIQLPTNMPAAFRCEIGKADGSDPGDGMLFQVVVVASDGTETIAAERQWAQHTWTPLEVDLSKWQGQQVTLKLITDVGPADNSTGDWGCWSMLHYESFRRELATEVSETEVGLVRAPAPITFAGLTLEDIRSAQSADLHFQGIGLQNGAPYISQARLNNQDLGVLPAANGDSLQTVWSDATIALTQEAIASLGEWNKVTLQNPGKDSFKIGRFWIELVLPDGRRASSEVTQTVFTQPADWLYAEGTGVSFDEDIQADIRFPIEIPQ